MAQNHTSDQNDSVAELEAEIAASRDRLARNIDELAFRAQPKQIIKSQKESLVASLKGRYQSFMGTSQRETYHPYSEDIGEERPGMKGRIETLKAQASAKADELKAQAEAKVAQVKDRTGAGESTVAFVDTEGGATVRQGTDAADRGSQARLTADQARLKLDEMTHTPDGDLRTDRIADVIAFDFFRA